MSYVKVTKKTNIACLLDCYNLLHVTSFHCVPTWWGREKVSLAFFMGTLIPFMRSPPSSKNTNFQLATACIVLIYNANQEKPTPATPFSRSPGSPRELWVHCVLYHRCHQPYMGLFLLFPLNTDHRVGPNQDKGTTEAQN